MDSTLRLCTLFLSATSTIAATAASL